MKNGNNSADEACPVSTEGKGGARKAGMERERVEGVSEDRDHLPTGRRASKRKNEAPAGDDGAFIVLALVERSYGRGARREKGGWGGGGGAMRLSATVAASSKPGGGRLGAGHQAPGGASSRGTPCRVGIWWSCPVCTKKICWTHCGGAHGRRTRATPAQSAGEPRARASAV
jgi:hypothetical protein